MQNTPFSIILAAVGEVLLIQNYVIGGSSVIEATEVAVIPARPAGPLVVTIEQRPRHGPSRRDTAPDRGPDLDRRVFHSLRRKGKA
jgi:hypothetical protein